jgi:hypothetical protein
VIPEPETLCRLWRVFFPESQVPVEWCGRLANVFAEYGVDEVDVIAYFHALFLHHNGRSSGNSAVDDSLRAGYNGLQHFGKTVTLIVRATSSERWIEQIIAFYEHIGVAATFTLDGGTSVATRKLLSAKGVSCIDIGDESPGDWPRAVLEKTGTEWILITRDDEIPSPALLAFADRTVKYSTNFAWGFPRVHCQYDPSSDELRYSQFLPFGPLANASLQWRLVARGDGPKERRTAAADAVLFNFDWAARSFAERVGLLRNDAPDGMPQASLASFNLYESVPERWHMWVRLREERLEEIARLMHSARRE